MTHRDRSWFVSGRKQAAGDAGHRQGLLTPSETRQERPERPTFRSFGTASPVPSDAPHRRGTRSLPKILKVRPYGSLSSRLGINVRFGSKLPIERVAVVCPKARPKSRRSSSCPGMVGCSRKPSSNEAPSGQINKAGIDLNWPVEAQMVQCPLFGRLT